MRETLIFLTTGFEEIEALATIDILFRGGVDVKSVSLTDSKAVTGGHNITVTADYLFDEVNFADAEMLILPGGSVKINEHDGLKREILAFAKQNKPIAAICAAPIVLGGLGLLEGKRVTCYPGYETFLTGAHVTGAPVMVDGNITTGRAAGYTFEFAFNLLEQLKGKKVVKEVMGKVLAK